MNYSNQMFTIQKLPVHTKCKSDKIFSLEYNHLSVLEGLFCWVLLVTHCVIFFLTLTLAHLMSHDFPSSLMSQGSGQVVICFETKQEETNSFPRE